MRREDALKVAREAQVSEPSSQRINRLCDLVEQPLLEEIAHLTKQRDDLVEFMNEIVSVTPKVKDRELWIHTVKIKAAALASVEEGK